MRDVVNNQKLGFTLIEIIVTLIIVGILAALGSMGLVQATKTFIRSKDASSISQKAQAALARMNKTFLNVTDISDPDDSSVTVTLERNGNTVTENFSFQDSKLFVERNGNSYPLLENLRESNSSFSYLKNDGSSWNPSSDSKKRLATIRVDFTLEGSSGIPVSFTGEFIPRNIYRPIDMGSLNGTGSGAEQNVHCFVASAAFDTPSKSKSVFILRQFRDKVLKTWSGGKWLVEQYYEHGPKLARIIDQYPFLKTPSRILLYPFVALSFLFLYYPMGFLVLFVAAYLLGRLFMDKRIKNKLRYVTCKDKSSGSILLNSIIIIVVLAALGAGMTKFFSTSSRQSIGTNLHKQAYYNAESGFRYVTYKFLNPDTGQDGIQTLDHKINGKSIELNNDGDRANIDIYTYWFEVDGTQNSTNNVDISAPVQYPDNYNSSSSNPDAVYVAEEEKLVSLNNINYNADRMILQDTVEVQDGSAIYPAYNSTYTGELSEGDDLNIPSATANFFPEKNGVVIIHTDNDNRYALRYEKKECDDGGCSLVNLQNVIRDFGLPSAGISADIEEVILQKTARVVSTGQVLSNGNVQSERKIEYYQPLLEGQMVKVHETTDDFENLDNWDSATGDHDTENKDGDSAMVVDQTEDKSSTASQSFEAAEAKESMVLQKSDTADFEGLWDKSRKVLSYEVQTKVHFTKEGDNDKNNTLGTYMPGVLFRERVNSEYNVREFFGMSFMRSYFDQRGVAEPDPDDIPNKDLIGDHPENEEIDDRAEDAACDDDYEKPPRWDDKPPKTGVPYVMFWQQALDLDEYDGLWSYNDDLYLDWLSYMPLCDVEEVRLYKYICCDKINEYDVAVHLDGTYYIEHIEGEPECGSDFDDCRTLIKNELDPNCNELEEVWEPGVNNLQCTDCLTGCNWNGWYEGTISDVDEVYIADNKTAYKLTPSSRFNNILEKSKVDYNENEYTILGRNASRLVKNASSKEPVENTAYVFPNENVQQQNNHNYRVYPKPWVTIMAKVVDLRKDLFDEDTDDDIECPNTEKERVNIIQAYFAANSTNPRGEVKWPEKVDFEQVIWPDRAYSSEMNVFERKVDVWWWNDVTVSYRIVERGEDEYCSDERRSPYAMSGMLTSDVYGDDDYDNSDISEVGLHTFGIDAEAGEKIYFDDFGLRIFEYGQKTGLLPAVQSEL